MVNGEKKETAQPVQIKVGISDGISTEVVDGLKEGDTVIVGQNNPGLASQPGTANPFGGGFRRY
jgi:HlyD family secretion protein